MRLLQPNLLRNPLRPSWGEPYTEIVIRMRAAIRDAARAAEGHAALMALRAQVAVAHGRTAAELASAAHSPAPAAAVAALLQAAP